MKNIRPDISISCLKTLSLMLEGLDCCLTSEGWSHEVLDRVKAVDQAGDPAGGEKGLCVQVKGCGAGDPVLLVLVES